MLEPIYAETGITIYHADCREVLPCLPSEAVDFTCTDPPYGVSFRGRFDKKHESIAGDDELTWVEPVFSEVYRVMRRDTFADLRGLLLRLATRRDIYRSLEEGRLSPRKPPLLCEKCPRPWALHKKSP